MKLITNNTKVEFEIDDEDYQKLLIHNNLWTETERGYIECWSKTLKRSMSIARIIMDQTGKQYGAIDHINRDKKDNKKCNLRLVTYSENSKNKNKYKTSNKYKGVTFYKRDNVFQCNIRVNKKLIYGGRFENEIDAAKKYNELAILYFGNFAVLNTIE